MAEKKKISYITYMRYKREIDALYTMGYRYDMEQDPKKKAALEEEIIRRCDKLKPKLGLKDVSDEEARALLGVNFGSAQKTEESAAEVAGESSEIEDQGADRVESDRGSKASDGA